jgi:hypothetical protein
VDVARGVIQTVTGRVQTIGRNLDSAVRNNIGVSPSTVFGGFLKQQQQGQLVPGSASSGNSSGCFASAWTRTCVRQADLVLLVGQAHTSSALSSAELATVFQAVKSEGCEHSQSTPPPAPGSPASAAAASTSREEERRPARTSDSGQAAAEILLPRTMAHKELVLLHHDPHRRPQVCRERILRLYKYYIAVVCLSCPL